MTVTSPSEFRGGPRAALGVRPFAWWFAGQVFSASGLMTQMVAVGWLVLSWHGSGLELGLLSTAGLGPTLVLGLWAGSLVDHHDRRSILIWTQSLLLGLSLVLYALIVSGAASYWPLIALTLATGSVNALDSPARQIYVLDLVGPERVAGAVSLITSEALRTSSAASAVRIIGSRYSPEALALRTFASRNRLACLMDRSGGGR